MIPSWVGTFCPTESVTYLESTLIPSWVGTFCPTESVTYLESTFIPSWVWTFCPTESVTYLESTLIPSWVGTFCPTEAIRRSISILACKKTHKVIKQREGKHGKRKNTNSQFSFFCIFPHDKNCKNS